MSQTGDFEVEKSIGRWWDDSDEARGADRLMPCRGRSGGGRGSGWAAEKGAKGPGVVVVSIDPTSRRVPLGTLSRRDRNRQLS